MCTDILFRVNAIQGPKIVSIFWLPNLIFVEFEPDIIWGTCKFV